MLIIMLQNLIEKTLIICFIFSMCVVIFHSIGKIFLTNNMNQLNIEAENALLMTLLINSFSFYNDVPEIDDVCFVIILFIKIYILWRLLSWKLKIFIFKNEKMVKSRFSNFAQLIYLFYDSI